MIKQKYLAFDGFLLNLNTFFLQFQTNEARKKYLKRCKNDYGEPII